MKLRRGAWLFLAVVLGLGAFYFRLPALTDRPMHTDEAVHAVKLGELLESGKYVYNPHEYHGPLIYYTALPFLWASGADSFAQIKDEWPLRAPIAVFGGLLVFVVALSGGVLGRGAALFAAVLFGASPAFAFYGRYFIQEVPFVLFLYLGLAGAWMVLQGRGWGWVILSGLAWGCAIALKETWIMVAGAAGLTGLLLHLTSNTGAEIRGLPWKRFGLRVFAGVMLALFVGGMLLSNFFRNIDALQGMFGALGGYINRGVSGDSSTFGSNVHDHTWWYYFQLLIWPPVRGPWVWTEGGTVLLGLIGLGAVIGRWASIGRVWHFIGIFTILLSGLYSGIAYKTPWNVLPMLASWTLLAGFGASAIVDIGRRWLSLICRARESRCVCFGGLMLWLLLLGWPGWLAMQSWRATILRPADIRNPYAYSPTSSNVFRLADRMEALARVSPLGHDLVIQIVAGGNDYWPLPWYLRRFDRIGYYTDFSGVVPEADVVIVMLPEDGIAPQPDATERLGSRMEEFYGLREGLMMSVFIKQQLWDEFMAGQLDE